MFTDMILDRTTNKYPTGYNNKIYNMLYYVSVD